MKHKHKKYKTKQEPPSPNKQVILKHIMIKLLRTCFKEKKLARGGEKTHYVQKNKDDIKFLIGNCVNEKASYWNGIFKVPKEKQNNCHPRILYPAKIPFTNEGGNEDVFRYMKAHQEGRGTVPDCLLWLF